MEFFSSSPAKKPCLIEEDDEDMEAGISGINEKNLVLCHLNFTKRNRLSNYSNYSSFPSPRSVGFSGRFHDSRFGSSRNLHKPHFLDSCHLCKNPIGANKDIFMYRGNIPFCSEECRQQEIDRDEIKEKKQSLCSTVKAMRRKEQRSSSSPTKSSKRYTLRSGTVAAA